MSAPTMLDPVAAYATDVRHHLADLAPDVLEDLTGGLEADLGESAADALAGASPTAHDLVVRFGTPEAYAAELRESAGLPAVGEAGARTRMADRVALLVRRWRQALEATPAWRHVRDFLVALTPLWWVLRGWALAAVVAVPFTSVAPPRDLLAWLLVMAGVVVSAQVGRGAWVLQGRWRVTWRVVSVVLIPVCFVVLFTTSDAIAQEQRSRGYATWNSAEYLEDIPAWGAFQYDATGVMIDGHRSTNLFVYGPDGELIDGAQIVDQSGRPLILGTGDGRLVAPDGVTVYVPRLDEDGRQVFNAFPTPWWQVPEDEDGIDDDLWPRLPSDAGVSVPRPLARTVAPLQALAEESGASSGVETPAADD